MRFSLALCVAASITTVPLHAEPLAQVPPPSEVIHRLDTDEVDAIFARKAAKAEVGDRLAQSQDIRLNGTGRTVTGILGFVGHLAAKSFHENRCGIDGVICRNRSSNPPYLGDVIR